MNTATKIIVSCIAIINCILVPRLALASKELIWSAQNSFIISLSFILFIACIVVFAYKSLIISKDANAVVRIYGVFTIIFLTIILVLAGFPAKQLNMILTLFGTIAGYLLGRTSTKSKIEQTH